MKITNTFEYKPTLDELAEEISNLNENKALELLSRLSKDSYWKMRIWEMSELISKFKGNEDIRNAKNFVAYLNDYLNGDEEN